MLKLFLITCFNSILLILIKVILLIPQKYKKSKFLIKNKNFNLCFY